MTETKETKPGSFEALDEAMYYWDLYSRAKDLSTQAHYYVQLSNAMDSLRSFHPDYQWESGTMPWDRDED